MWHELESVSDSCSSNQNGKFETYLKMHGTTSSIIQMKKMGKRKSQNEKKSKYLKNRKKHFCALLQDSSKSLEDKCVYTRLDLFIRFMSASNPLGIIKNLQSRPSLQKILSCVPNFLDSSKDSKIKSDYSHLHACARSKTSIQKNTREHILRKQENGCVWFHLIPLVGIKAIFFHSNAIAHVFLKKKQALHKVHSSLWNGLVKDSLSE